MILEQAEIDRIADAVAARLSSKESVKWLTKTEAAAHLNCSVRHLERITRLGEVPYFRPAGRPLYRAEDLDQYITNRRAA